MRRIIRVKAGMLSDEVMPVPGRKARSMPFTESNNGATINPKARDGNTPKDRAVHERALNRMREEIKKNPEAAVRYLRQLGMFNDGGTVKKDSP